MPRSSIPTTVAYVFYQLDYNKSGDISEVEWKEPMTILACIPSASSNVQAVLVFFDNT